MSPRDRDEEGRARNTRPRDATGRPLPYGAAGVERPDEDVVLAPDESLAQAQRLLDDGFPFHAHEILEAAWKGSPDEERTLWKGLAQVAVGLTHEQRGNLRGAVSLLRRGADNVAEGAAFADRHGLDAPTIAAWARRRADHREAGDPPDGTVLVLR